MERISRKTAYEEDACSDELLYAEGWCYPDDIPKVQKDADLRFIMARWPAIAALAWQSFLKYGRGTIMLDTAGELHFLVGAPCECHQDRPGKYDPTTEVVVALYRETVIRVIHTVAGWPAPPDAFKITPMERLRLTNN